MYYSLSVDKKEEGTMLKIVVITGILLFVCGLIGPHLSIIGIGKLPGDILLQVGGVVLYLPVVSCLLVSILISLLLKVVGKYLCRRCGL